MRASCLSHRSPHPAGFTLVEMAVVLLILGLLLGGMLGPLSSRIEESRRSETNAAIAAVRDALVGYAVINKRLPCPDANGNGLDDDACSASASTVHTGALPGAALGVSAVDAWGAPLTYAVNGAWTGTLAITTQGSGSGRLQVSDAAGCAGGMLGDNVAAVVVSGAKTPWSDALETENRDGDRCYVAAGYSAATGTEFDDLVAWVSPSVLINRLVAAGMLP